MDFITSDDFRVVIGETAFRAFSQSDTALQESAVSEAIEEVSGYLRPVYDVDKIFSATGTDRNRFLVMIVVDAALYHLSASQPQKMGSEVRRERYERAVRWLEGVQAGRIDPGLPTVESESGDSPLGSVFIAQPRLRHNW
jgi:phage gp36-like protein